MNISNEKGSKLNRYLFVTGIIMLVIGAIDPLEGSILIMIGSLLLAWSAYKRRDSQWKFFMITFLLITIGVGFLFFFSWLGGFGGNSALSWWWALLILPYPIGWLMEVIFLSYKAFGKAK